MRKISIIHIIGILILILISAPIFYLLLQVFNSNEWVLNGDLMSTYIKNTLIMVFIVGFLSASIGITSAWIVSFYDFPLRKLFKIILALPLAIPPYIAAHSYADFTYSGGLFPKFLYNFGIDKYFDILNIKGAIFIYTITLYPYVYLMCLSFFKNSSSSLIDNARMLKANYLKIFFKVGLPMARLPIIAGITLVIMELVSDFGVVDYFGVQAFSTGIYKTWFNYGDFYGSIRLSSILLIIILGFVLIEIYTTKRLKYYTTSKANIAKLIKTKKFGSFMILSYFLILIFVSFLIPLIQLIYNSSYVYMDMLNSEMLDILWNTFYYSGISSLICVFLSFIIANYTQKYRNGMSTFISRIATMGYSVPGVIIGLAVIFTFIDVDKLFKPIYKFLGFEKNLVLSTSIFILIFAYIVRFLAVSYNNIYSGYKKINPNLFKAAHTLGYNSFKTFYKVDLPLMIPTLMTSFLMVFLEIVKELPITLMLKPYNVETLTGKIYTYVHNEQYAEVAVPSLIIIFLGIIAVSITMLYREKNYAKS